MRQSTPNTMHAAAIDRFGGVETLALETLPVPEVGPDEVLIHVESAGVGAWDPFEREGGFAKRFGTNEKFPYVLGTDGAGTVARVGEQVNGFKEGDRVYAAVLANPKGGFYAEFAAVKADNVSHVPDQADDRTGGRPVERRADRSAGFGRRAATGARRVADDLRRRRRDRTPGRAARQAHGRSRVGGGVGRRRRGAGSTRWRRCRRQRSQGRRGGGCPRVRARRPRCCPCHRRRRDDRSGAGGAARWRARRLSPRRNARAEGPRRRACQQLRRQPSIEGRSPSSTA